MMSDRHYRKRLSFDQAVVQLRTGKGSQFDPCLVDAFLEVLEDYDTICGELQWTYEENNKGRYADYGTEDII